MERDSRLQEYFGSLGLDLGPAETVQATSLGEDLLRSASVINSRLLLLLPHYMMSAFDSAVGRDLVCRAHFLTCLETYAGEMLESNSSADLVPLVASLRAARNRTLVDLCGTRVNGAELARAAVQAERRCLTGLRIERVITRETRYGSFQDFRKATLAKLTIIGLPLTAWAAAEHWPHERQRMLLRMLVRTLWAAQLERELHCWRTESREGMGWMWSLSQSLMPSQSRRVVRVPSELSQVAPCVSRLMCRCVRNYGVAADIAAVLDAVIFSDVLLASRSAAEAVAVESLRTFA